MHIDLVRIDDFAVKKNIFFERLAVDRRALKVGHVFAAKTCLAETKIGIVDTASKFTGIRNDGDRRRFFLCRGGKHYPCTDAGNRHYQTQNERNDSATFFHTFPPIFSGTSPHFNELFYAAAKPPPHREQAPPQQKHPHQAQKSTRPFACRRRPDFQACHPALPCRRPIPIRLP